MSEALARGTAMPKLDLELLKEANRSGYPPPCELP
jgi:hypothetical protein